MPKLAAVGIDGAEWSLIEQMLERGDLPCLTRIRQRSAECRLRNPVMYRSTLVWEAFLTGKEDHADPKLGGVEFEPSSYGTYKIGAGSQPPFFTALPGIRAIAFDVPHLSLAGAERDVRICTWGSNSRSYPRAARPAGLLRMIDATFGSHPAFGDEHAYAWHRPPFVDWLTRALATGARRRVEIALWLQKRFPDWQLFLTVMSEAHSAGETFGHVLDDEHPLAHNPMTAYHRTKLADVYRAIDDAVGAFAAKQSPDTVLVVFSLHGTTSNDGELSSTVLLPELLHRLTFRKPFLRDPDRDAWQRAGYPPVIPDLRDTWNRYMLDRRADRAVNEHRRRLRRALPDRLLEMRRSLSRRLAGRFLYRYEPATAVAAETDLAPPEIGEPRWPIDWAFPCGYRRFWPQMKAFALPTFGDARIRINVQGRERDGVVTPADYERTCTEVEDSVRACCDPRTGRPVVESVMRTRSAANMMDPAGPDADLTISWLPRIDAFEHPEAGTIGPFPFHRTGAHTSRGFAFFSGPGIERADLGEHDAINLTPTLVALLGHEPRANLDGRPIPRVIPSS
jgi:predicted AlkP superfamily phosphohydrolase/phosphomutase